MLRLRNLLGVMVFVGLVAGGSWLVLNRQLVLDHVRVWRVSTKSAHDAGTAGNDDRQG